MCFFQKEKKKEKEKERKEGSDDCHNWMKWAKPLHNGLDHDIDNLGCLIAFTYCISLILLKLLQFHLNLQ